MCFGKCAKCIGYKLLILAILCIVANILLYFPNGETKYASENHLSRFVWFFHGIGGAGLLMLLPAGVFIGLEDDDCCGCCGHEKCGRSCAMLSSILAAIIGICGAGYCVIVSALGLVEGPNCLVNNEWTYPFRNSNGSYLTNHAIWSQCTEPSNVVVWNVTLFSILLGLSAIQVILCIIQVINGFIGGLCGCCCEDKSQPHSSGEKERGGRTVKSYAFSLLLKLGSLILQIVELNRVLRLLVFRSPPKKPIIHHDFTQKKKGVELSGSYICK
ncbi:transmembrane 4 L6 family member 1 [Pelodytes ibericus]